MIKNKIFAIAVPSMERLKQMMNDTGLAVTLERDDENYFICNS